MTVTADKLFAPSNSYYEIIAASDEVCPQNTGCNGGSSLSASWFDKPNFEHHRRSIQSQAKNDPRDIKDLTKRFVGEVGLSEGALNATESVLGP